MDVELDQDALRGTLLGHLLERMLQRGASDLHLKQGSLPGMRIGAQLEREGAAALTGEDIQEIVQMIVPEHLQPRLASCDGDLDLAFGVSGVSRYRVSVFRQRGTHSVVLRRIPVEIPDLFRLGVPEIACRLAMLPRGLVLVTGPTGSGKSTTLAAIIDYLNRESARHVITMEDPIEFLHADQRSFITQRQVGFDCINFSQALRKALRQDPDVIMIGELRDLETISMALTAAETGHLVFATLHTTGAVQTIDRVLDAFPVETRTRARIQLATTLQAVISQILVPKLRGGRTAAFEVLVASDAVRSCIREEKTHQIANLLQTGSAFGMQTLDAALAELVRMGSISAQTALETGSNPEQLAQWIGATSGRAPNRNDVESWKPAPLNLPTSREPNSEEAAQHKASILEKLRRG